jgi:hypothetical protein
MLVCDRQDVDPLEKADKCGDEGPAKQQAQNAAYRSSKIEIVHANAT